VERFEAVRRKDESERARGGRRLRGGLVRLRHGSHEIGAANDADHAALAQHRSPLDPLRRQDLGNLDQIGGVGDGDHRRGHDLAGGPVLALDMGHELLAQLFAFGQHAQPPVAPLVTLGFIARQQIAFAHHADQRARVVDHRHGADPVLEQQHGDRARRRIRPHGDHLARHDVRCLQ